MRRSGRRRSHVNFLPLVAPAYELPMPYMETSKELGWKRLATELMSSEKIPEIRRCWVLELITGSSTTMKQSCLWGSARISILKLRLDPRQSWSIAARFAGSAGCSEGPQTNRPIPLATPAYNTPNPPKGSDDGCTSVYERRGDVGRSQGRLLRRDQRIPEFRL
ncbi:hypothetical protein BDQ12DRAFT_682214 [Crucibulum laeve]|uniref:Uncharacterized protein n=1 Tax=Crucibulum laeve TaxID=68775 RepID=A0A5C3MD85_9AGAR|nr:hypothetical protein BDQ12DRAFT_682214 [Crucibulum laeve]